MFKLNKLFLLTLITVLIEINAQKNCPTGQAIEADLCFQKLVLYGDRKFKWATNSDELNDLCSQIKINDKCVRKYAKNCLSALPQQVVGLLLKGASSQVKKHCTSKNKVSDIVLNSFCGNSNIDHDHVCMEDFVQQVKNAQSLPADIRLSGVCCSFNTFSECISNRLKKDKNCKTSSVDFFKKLVSSITGEAIDLVCSEYKNNPKNCFIINESMKKVKKVITPSQSLILPLVEIIKTIS